MRDKINEKLVELAKRRDGVWQRQVSELLEMIDKHVEQEKDSAIRPPRRNPERYDR